MYYKTKNRLPNNTDTDIIVVQIPMVNMSKVYHLYMVISQFFKVWEKTVALGYWGCFPDQFIILSNLLQVTNFSQLLNFQLLLPLSHLYFSPEVFYINLIWYLLPYFCIRPGTVLK